VNQFERLTKRELQVALLVASGLTDREIAERLLVARRTAEWHVEQILAKVGLKSRSQIASLVTQAETLGAPLVATHQPRIELPSQAAAFLGYKPEMGQRELLETIRPLSSAPGEDTDARRHERLAALAEAGYNPVVVDFIYGEALRTGAAKYPNTKFAILDDSSLSRDYPNVTGLVFAAHEGSYLVGAIAAQASRNGAVGFIGGAQVPVIAKFQAGYAAGAAAVKPGISVIVKYLADPSRFGGFSNPVKARAVAAAMYEAGADVIYHAAGRSGAGVFQAAKAAGHWAIGVDLDEYLTAATDTRASILTSMLKRVDEGVRRYIRAMDQRSSFPRVARFDLGNEGVAYSKSNPLVQPYVNTADSLRELIVAGRIRVPDTP
jgi:basic membrane protein A and related proteins